MEPEKIASISEYFKKLFPSAEHDNQNDFSRMTHMFRIVTNDQVMMAGISREFSDDYNVNTIISTLDQINICKLLTENPTATVIVTSFGPKIVPRR